MNISIRTNLRQAAESFMIAHKLQPDHLPDSVEEVMEHLDIEGQVMDCGERFIKKRGKIFKRHYCAPLRPFLPNVHAAPHNKTIFDNFLTFVMH